MNDNKEEMDEHETFLFGIGICYMILLSAPNGVVIVRGD